MATYGQTQTKMKKIMVLTIGMMLLMAGQVFALSPNFTIHPGTNLEVGEEVLFNAEGTTESTYPQFLIGSVYEWDFGDGTYMKYGYPLAYHTFSGIATTHFFKDKSRIRPGYTYRYYVRAIDPTGNEGPASDVLEVTIPLEGVPATPGNLQISRTN